MTLRIKRDLYDLLVWATTVNQDIRSMSDVIRMAVRVHDRRRPYCTDPGSGEVVLNVELDQRPADEIRAALQWFLEEQKRKIDARQVAPLSLDECKQYTVEMVQ